jgi:hypothetical protein
MNHYHYQSEFTSPAQLSEIQYGGFELSRAAQRREKNSAEKEISRQSQ